MKRLTAAQIALLERLAVAPCYHPWSYKPRQFLMALGFCSARGDVVTITDAGREYINNRIRSRKQ